MAFLLPANCRQTIDTDWNGALSAHEFVRARRQALQITFAQLLALLVVAAACGLAWGLRSGVSAAVGGSIGIVAQAGSAFISLRDRPGASAARIAGRVFLGWLTKVLFTLALLVIAFRSRRLSPLPLLCGYAVTILMYGVAAARVTKLPSIRRD